MKRALLLAAFFACPATAHAQDNAALCAFWNTHKSAPAAYQPGVDVRGIPVTPADINAPMPSMIPSRISFPLTVELAKAFHIPVPGGTKMDADMGIIDVYTDGRVLYNGQDMSLQAQAFCTGQPVPELKPATTPQGDVQAEQKMSDEEIIWGEGH